MGETPQVVILGGGFGGLAAARALKGAPVRVLVLDRSNHHLFQPLLYQVATAGLSPAEIAAPIRRILRSQEDATVLLAEATGLDPEGRRVKLADGEIPYDRLVVATGATHSYFGHDDWAPFAPGLKTLDDALDIRRRVLVAFEEAERESDSEKRRQWLTFLVIGGGPTGVEMAGAFAEISRQALPRDFRRIDPRTARVILVEAGPRILAAYPADLSDKAARQLEALGVQVWTGAAVTKIDAEGVEMGSDRVAARTVMWAAGIQASRLARSLGVPLDRAGRVRVAPDLTVPGRPDVFVIGDLAAIEHEGRPVPGVAPAAMQMGEHAARNVVRSLRGEPLLPFRYRDKGSLATIGRSRAVAVMGALKLSGFVAWAAWLAIHIFFLIGFRNRFVVLFTWTWAYFTYQRSARLILGRGTSSSGTVGAALLAGLLLAPTAFGQPRGFPSDETRVPVYTLPDPLVFADGRPVRDAREWREGRRLELRRLFEENVYGRSPGRPAAMRFEVVESDPRAFGGRATRKQVRVRLDGATAGPGFDLLLYVPNGTAHPVPAFLGANFGGNHAVQPDPGIRLSAAWMRDGPGIVDHRATDATRGREAGSWPVERILDRGYALATYAYGDVEPDHADGWKDGVRARFGPGADGALGPGDWGAIGAWAWGLSRALDYLETDPDVDARRVAVLGHSRLGKTALWAGATDERFALVISNDSGEGGAALARREFGERTADITREFPHWFCPRLREYAGREADLPVDQHELLALVAPRPLYVASASEDAWADPRGEFLAAKAAEPVYRLFGLEGLGADDMPGPDRPVGRTIGYHLRRGPHALTAYDWEQYLEFADRHLGRSSAGLRWLPPGPDRGVEHRGRVD